MELIDQIKPRLEQSEAARLAFVESGLMYSDVNISSFNRLVELINESCLDHPNMKMQTARILKKDMVFNADGSIKRGFIKVKGPYFDKREAVSFNDDGFIGFAGWADKYNVQPFVKAFEKWVVELTKAERRNQKER